MPTGKLLKPSNGDPGHGVFGSCQTPHGMPLLEVLQQKLQPPSFIREPVRPDRSTSHNAVPATRFRSPVHGDPGLCLTGP